MSTEQTNDYTDRVIQLERDKEHLNQMVGELREAKRSFQSQKLKEEGEKEDSEKIMIKELTYKTDPYSGRRSMTPHKREVSYKNLDSVVEDIRKEESKKLKIDNTDLSEKLLDIEIQLKKAKNALGRERDNASDKLNERVRKLKELHSKDREGFLKEIDALQEELEKEKDNKTDRELEKKRNEEIKTLKSRIKNLEKQIDDLLSINIFKRAWRKLTNYSTKKAMIKDEIEQQADVNCVHTTNTHGLDYSSSGWLRW